MMNDKVMAGLVAAVAIAPICAICVLGPAAVVATVVGATGWLGGASSVLTAGLMVAAGALVLYIRRRWGLRRTGIAVSARPPTVANDEQRTSPGSQSLITNSQRGHEQ